MGKHMQMVGTEGLLVSGVCGHSVEFQGMESPVRVVDALVDECLAAGAVPVPEPEDKPVVKLGRPAKVKE